ncbi:LLM class F420-dependent oxidoreductase [Actinoplanes lobatus]|uniref:LLM class F420-dependent oxidoreductase n=1 Tax=Actinoplanes lobatus TaxID=113568 RepID=A0A7W7HKI9_9ACTN|nr:TIGR03619 family F420-dependent LLM class oxidoreductase [Actinoplanes lobatus]MBB4752241.1 putative F420-dependent oxidoreductase [Actinoplanes lobatus]GGN99774.1 LLM class F420-dependent oxidoreductase [Actinoplanes lobatus]GIE45432.1 LLM class F420-dependent oxidoreductase [Actinoplanes lobatus]
MKFAISYSTASLGVDPEHMVAYARHAEACGFEALYMPEHVVLYRGAVLGSMELPPDLPLVDPLDALSFVAAATSRILLGTGVLLLPYQHPVVLAKRLATIDVLSRGRMRLLTVGLGSLPGEARAVGVDFRSRGRRADEAIDVLRLLWSGGAEGVSFHGEFFDFDDLCSFPKPYGMTTLPIHVGGSSRAAARRAGQRGDGYFPGGMLSPQERATQLDMARSEAEAAGRDPGALEYTRWASISMTRERAEALAAEGVTRVVVNVTSTDRAEQQDEMSALAERFDLPCDDRQR